MYEEASTTSQMQSNPLVEKGFGIEGCRTEEENKGSKRSVKEEVEYIELIKKDHAVW